MPKLEPKAGDGEISVMRIKIVRLHFNICGVTPLLQHSMALKAQHHLLYPPKKKTRAERDTTLKHDPIPEFHDACYKFEDEDDGEQPTRLYMPGSAFHSAMAAVAIDMAGATKAEIGRLTSIEAEKVPCFGLPQMWSGVVRSSDMARTPDIRFLPILKQWAVKIRVDFVSSLIRPESISNLLAAAGEIVGVGDGRPQKGKLSFGKFRTCDDNDPEFLSIMKKQGRAAQDEALTGEPKFYDRHCEALVRWFESERTKRHASPVVQEARAEIAATRAAGKRAAANKPRNGGGAHDQLI